MLELSGVKSGEPIPAKTVYSSGDMATGAADAVTTTRAWLLHTLQVALKQPLSQTSSQRSKSMPNNTYHPAANGVDHRLCRTYLTTIFLRRVEREAMSWNRSLFNPSTVRSRR